MPQGSFGRSCREIVSPVLVLLAVVAMGAMSVGCAKKEPVPLASGAIGDVSTPTPTPSPSPTITPTPGGPADFEDNVVETEEEFDAALERLSVIAFEFDESELTPAAKRLLTGVAEFLRKNPKFALIIEGHADERGTNAYNLALGQRRADAVYQYLRVLGIGEDRLSTVSYGEERPMVQGSSEDAYAQNRRVQFTKVVR